MLTFEPFKAEHADDICPYAVDDEVADWTEAAKINEKYGVGYTGYLDGTPVCAFGAICNKNGAGDVWFVMSRKVGMYKKTVLRSIKMMLDTHMEDSDFTRLRTASKIGFKESQRLLEFLGFKKQRRDMINGKYYFYLRGA
jgi:hypothetical protein